MNNIKNLAKAMILKYMMMLLYIIGFGAMLIGHVVVVLFLGGIMFILMMIMIVYDWKFILGEMEE